MKKIFAFLICCILSLCFGGPGHTVNLPLGLHDVVDAALQNNLGLKAERLTPQITQQTLLAEEAAFDPNLRLGGSSSRRLTEADLADSKRNDYSVTSGIGKKFTPGTDVSVNVAWITRNYDTSATPSGEGSSTAATLVVTQPLLKNRGSAINGRNIALANKNQAIARLNLRQAVIDTVSKAKNLYWQYYYALALLDVQQHSLDLARRSLEEMEEKIRLGSAPHLDLLQSQAEVASREENCISAENMLYTAQDQLLNYAYGSIITTDKVTPVDPPILTKMVHDEQQLVATALDKRTNYLISDLNLRSSETDVIYFDNQRLPQLDLTATLGVNDGNPDTTSVTSPTDEFDDYRYGTIKLSLDLPIGRHRDNANHAAALLKNRQKNIDRLTAQAQIRLEVRSALRNLYTAEKRNNAARLSKKYAGEALQIEEEKNRSGLSTSYQVMLMQRDLTDAGATEAEAIKDYQTALIDLHKAVGTTMEENNITMDEVEQ